MIRPKCLVKTKKLTNTVQNMTKSSLVVYFLIFTSFALFDAVGARKLVNHVWLNDDDSSEENEPNRTRMEMFVIYEKDLIKKCC